MEINLTSEQIHHLKYLVLMAIADAKKTSMPEIQKVYEEILLKLDQGFKEENNLN